MDFEDYKFYFKSQNDPEDQKFNLMNQFGV